MITLFSTNITSFYENLNFETFSYEVSLKLACSNTYMHVIVKVDDKIIFDKKVNDKKELKYQLSYANDTLECKDIYVKCLFEEADNFVMKLDEKF